MAPDDPLCRVGAMSAIPDVSLSDGVVTLRPPHERDLPAIERGLHDADVVRWLGAPDGSAADLLALNRSRWAAGSPTFAICIGSAECVGHVWLNVDLAEPTVGEVGYWLLPEARHRGLATRGVRLVSDWATRDFGIERLRIVMASANRNSQAVARRAGFHRAGRRSARRAGGRSAVQIVFERTLSEA